MSQPECRACRSPAGFLVLDLGRQPACDYFPRFEDPGPDPVYPLELWLCDRCGLAQLASDPTVPEEPRGTEPAALVEQGRTRWSGWPGQGCCQPEAGSPSMAARMEVRGWGCWLAAG